MNRGFTLIELLVAISIIAVLSTIGLTIFSGVQSKARDSVRKNDLNALATALELYFQNNGKYIAGVGSCSDNTSNSTFNDDIKQYLNELPQDPKSDNPPYCYEAVTGGLNYKLYAKLEDGTDYILISEDFIAQATPTLTSTAVPTPIPAPPPLPIPPPGLPRECDGPVTATISVKAFLADPVDNPTDGSVYPTCFGTGCQYNHAPLKNVIIHARPTGFQCFAAATYGVTDSAGVASIDVYSRWEYDPGDGTQILETIPYEIWAEIPSGDSLHRGSCYQKRYRGGSLCDIVDVQTTGKGAQCDEDQSIEKGCLLYTNFGFTR